jgi:hypothetical protein
MQPGSWTYRPARGAELIGPQADRGWPALTANVRETVGLVVHHEGIKPDIHRTAIEVPRTSGQPRPRGSVAEMSVGGGTMDSHGNQIHQEYRIWRMTSTSTVPGPPVITSQIRQNRAVSALLVSA